MQKRLKVAEKHTIRNNAGLPMAVEFRFTDGTIERLALDELPNTMRLEAMAHGIRQKAGDEYSGVKGDIRAAIACVRRVFDNLRNGVWNAARDGSGGGYLAEAVAEVTGRTLEEVTTLLAAMPAEQKADLRAKHPQVKAVIARLRAEALERAAQTSDVPDVWDLF